MHVVATAGHVDHGKSTLVRALTGHDPDRLREEKERGLTIRLGYCWTRLPEVGDVAFVDVPGHERFLTTALAGLGSVPVAMFVVAADDPWMPQAAEHLAALHALGVEHGLLVVTRADLADPASALARAREQLARTSLAGVPEVVVSGRTGHGLEALRDLLVRTLAALPAADPETDTRLWVDRTFHVRGAGTVVTGTLPAGTVRVGDRLAVDEHELVRVRDLECLGEKVAAAQGVARVALDLGGRPAKSLGHDAVLVTPEAFDWSRAVDVRVTGSDPLPSRPMLHVGATAQAVRARPLGDRHARLTLERALPLRYGDRALLRDPGRRAIWGAVVLDVAPPELRRRGAAATRAGVLSTLDGSLSAELEARGQVPRDQLRRHGLPDAPVPPGAITASGWLLSATRADELRTALERFDEGSTVDAAAAELGVPDPRLLTALLPSGVSVRDGRLRTAAPEGDPAVGAAEAALRRHLEGRPFAAPGAEELVPLGLTPKVLAVLARDRRVLRLAETVVLLPDAADEAVRLLGTLEQPFTAGEARQALGSSRRVVLPLLDHLDRAGRTVRFPDDRRRLRS